ncbi:hypothetical protein EPO04_00795 [Patescibacteria group bacterium]|nr:MAG: hypothetical protein EPO04_00795 [Patescibacteria group bacterium]
MARTIKSTNTEYDSVYFLKVLLYLVLATTWLAPSGHRYVPVGLIIGVIIVQHERFQIDRKIEYAVMLVGAVLGLVGIGITISI